MNSESFFSCLSDSTRLRVLVLLQSEGELCVCDLVGALDDSQPKVSRHLAMLRRAGVVRTRRSGKWVHYSIAPGLPAWMGKVLETTLEGVTGELIFSRDRHRRRVLQGQRGPAFCD